MLPTDNFIINASPTSCSQGQRSLSRSNMLFLLRLQSKQLQDFSMHFYLWQVLLSGLLECCLLCTPTTIECRLDKMCLPGLLLSGGMYSENQLAGSSFRRWRMCPRDLNLQFWTWWKRFCIGHEIYIMVLRMWSFCFYVEHNPAAGSHKCVDFTFPVMRAVA